MSFYLFVVIMCLCLDDVFGVLSCYYVHFSAFFNCLLAQIITVITVLAVSDSCGAHKRTLKTLEKQISFSVSVTVKAAHKLWKTL